MVVYLVYDIMNTSAEYQLDIGHLKETEEGVEVYLFLQSLKNFYNISDIVGTFICSKVKNIINSFRHKAKRLISEELKANEIVSSKVDNIISTALRESNFEKLFEYYSGVSYATEFKSNNVPGSGRTIYYRDENASEQTSSKLYPSSQIIPLVKTNEKVIGNRPTKRVFIEYQGESHIIHLKYFKSISNLKISLCKEMNLKREDLSDSSVQYFCKDSKQWADLKSWSALKSDECLRLLHRNQDSVDIKPQLEVEDKFCDIDVNDPPHLPEKNGLPTMEEFLEDYRSSGGKMKWIEEFKLPKFDSKISKKMQDGKIISSTERIKICQVITESVKPLNATHISGKEVQVVLKCLFLSYPKLKDLENDYWLTWNIWKVTLENMFDKLNTNEAKVNVEVTEKHDTNESSTEAASSSKSTKRKVQTTTSAEKKKKQDNRPSRVEVNIEQVNEVSFPHLGSGGMDATFEERRMQIVSEDWSIEDIFVSYPWLHSENEIFAEFSRVVGFTSHVDKVMEEEFSKLTEPLLYIMKTQTKSRLVADKEKELRTLEKKNKSASNFNYKMALFLLPLAIGEDIETIFKQSGSYYDEPIQIEYAGGELYDNGKSYSVVVECCKIECTNLKKAVAVYFCCFFIFNLAYPSDIKKFLYAIERHIFNIPGRAPPPTSVVKLFSKVEDYYAGKDSM